jgi:hypothetical protein
MKYISLKEASAISGYAPDYIGQLIRSGKLSGKQVYSNVAWVTTEAALDDYLNNKQPRNMANLSEKSEDLLEKALPKFLKGFLIGVVTVSLCFAIVLFYIFSVQIDAKLKQKAIQNAEISIK